VLYECLVGSDQLRIAVSRSREPGARDPFPGLEGLLPHDPLRAPLVTFLSRALSKDVHRRPSSAGDFGDILRRLGMLAERPEFQTTRPDVKRGQGGQT
jgi:hypothetical protein